jgi:WD40 repeat protein
MNLDKARKIILELLEKEGKATNSKMLRHIGSNISLLDEVREELIMDDLAFDKDGVGLIYIGERAETKGKYDTLTDAKVLDRDNAVKSKDNLVFISYGRMDAIDFARQLRRDLINTGYKTWMDESNIVAGGLWEVHIEQGIHDSSLVLAIITPHSVREESVCRDEIIYAINSGKEVIPIKTTRHVQTTLMLSRRNWIDFSEDYYNAFQRLTEHLKGGSQELSSPVLPSVVGVKPFDFSYEIANYTNFFIGRDWLNIEIEKWITKTKSRAMVIVGGAGIGKSAIAAWISQKRTAQVISIHFCTRRNMRTLDPFEYVAALVGQLATQIPEYHDLVCALKPDQRRSTASLTFRELVIEPLSQIKNQKETKLLIIDSLDEALLQEGESVLNVVVGEAARLPEWIRLICTTRPEKPILDKIRYLNTFELIAHGKENLKDVSNYINKILESQGLPSRLQKNSAFITQKLITLANGNFLYAKMALDALINDNLPFCNLNHLKGQLSDFYLQIFKQRFDNIDEYAKRYAPLLSVLVASKEPLSKSLLKKVLKIDERELRLRLQPLRIYIRQLASTEKVEIAFLHKSLRDWLTNDKEAGPYRIDPRNGHLLLVNTIITLWQDDEYSLRHLPEHLIAAENWSEVEEVLTNLIFVESKIKAGLIYGLQMDYKLALDTLPKVQSEKQDRLLHEKKIEKYEHSLTAFASGEKDHIDIIESIKPWDEEKIIAKGQRIIKDPSPLDNIKAFAQFISLESHALTKFGERDGFVIQQAYNYTDSGPVTKRAEEFIKNESKTVFLLSKKEHRPKFNPYSALIRTLEGHVSNVVKIESTVDGKKAISAGYDKTVRYWDIDTGECLRTFTGHTSYVNCVSISYDGKKAISGSSDKTLRVWDVSSGKCIMLLEGHSGDVEDVCFSGTGNTAISGSSDKTLRVWDIQSGDCRQTLMGHTDVVYGVSLSPDGTIAVSASKDKTLRIWDLKKGHCRKVLKGHTRGVKGVCLTPDSSKIVSAGFDKTLRVWDLKSGNCLRTLSGHSKLIEGVSISADGRIAVTASRDKNIRIWDINTGECIKVLKGHIGWVGAVKVISDGRIAISAGYDKTVRVWDVQCGINFINPNEHTKAIYDVSIAPDGKKAVSAGRDTTIRIWNMLNGECVKVLTGHEGWVNTLCFTLDNRYLVSGSNDKTIRIWNLTNGECLRSLTGHDGWVSIVVITPDDKKIVSGSNDNTVRVWDIHSGECLNILKGHTERINGLYITPENRKIISASHDNTLIVWDVNTGEALNILTGHTDSITGVKPLPDNNYAISISWDNTIRIWDIHSGDCVKVLKGHKKGIIDICITPDGKSTISAGYYNTQLLVWDLQNGQCLKELTGHSDRIYRVISTSINNMVISISKDNTLRIWDIENGRCLGIYSAPGPVYSVSCMSEKGDLLIGLESGKVIGINILNLQ